MKRLSLLLLGIFLLTSCFPVTLSATSTQTAVNTLAVQVTQTPQLADINLDSIPYQPGDLPEPYHSGQKYYGWVEYLPQAAEPDNVIIQKVGWDISSDLNNDFVLIALYGSAEDLQASYEAVKAVFPTIESSPSAVGERSAIYISADPGVGPGYLAFTHCSALVVIQFVGATVTEEMFVSYAQRIDERLQPLVCQPLTPSETPGMDTEELVKPIVYYYFVEIPAAVYPEGSVVIMPDVLILAPTASDMTSGTDTAANIRSALEAMINDARNAWTGTDLVIESVVFDQGHADVILRGKIFGAGDILLVSARMQILMTIFADPAVRTATVTLNGESIGNLGVSHGSEAKPADYEYTRMEVEIFMAENAVTP
jgi:hypothetical protein